MNDVDPAATLAERDGAWPEPGPDATALMRRVHEARRVPVGRLGIESLRLLIGQQESLEILVPLAVDRLVADPLAEGDYFPGDLLTVVLRLPAAFWDAHPEPATSLRAALRELDPGLVDDPELLGAVDAFVGR